MINGENDVLERTVEENARFVDAFYVLDGTSPHEESKATCLGHSKCAAYTRDCDLDGTYPTKPVDGYRQFIYEQAVADYGVDNWFLLLHGDEVWTEDPLSHIDGRHDGYIFRLPFYFPRAGETWDYEWHPLDQLQWYLGPGFPEFRMFKGSPDVRFDKSQHWNVTPQGLKSLGMMESPIKHYLYRSPAHQRARASQHERSGFDPDNYRHILERDEVYWSDEKISKVLNDPTGYYTYCRRDRVLA